MTVKDFIRVMFVFVFVMLLISGNAFSQDDLGYGDKSNEWFAEQDTADDNICATINQFGNYKGIIFGLEGFAQDPNVPAEKTIKILLYNTTTKKLDDRTNDCLEISYTKSIMDIDSGDVDLDGDNDFAIILSGGGTRLFRNNPDENGLPHFTEEIIQEDWNSMGFSIELVDVNLDGLLDVVSGNYGWVAQVGVCYNNFGGVPGSFNPQRVDLFNGHRDYTPHDIKSYKLNGVTYIAVCSLYGSYPGWGQNALFTVNNDGVLRENIALYKWTSGIDVCDVNKDNIPEVVLGASDGLYLGTVGSLSSISTLDSGLYCYDVKFGDLDLNGNEDIVIATYYNYNYIKVYSASQNPNDPQNSFTYGNLTTLENSYGESDDAHVTDLDSNGDPEIVIANHFRPSQIYSRESTATGEWKIVTNFDDQNKVLTLVNVLDPTDEANEGKNSIAAGAFPVVREDEENPVQNNPFNNDVFHNAYHIGAVLTFTQGKSVTFSIPEELGKGCEEEFDAIVDIFRIFYGKTDSSSGEKVLVYNSETNAVVYEHLNTIAPLKHGEDITFDFPASLPEVAGYSEIEVKYLAVIRSSNVIDPDFKIQTKVDTTDIADLPISFGAADVQYTLWYHLPIMADPGSITVMYGEDYEWPDPLPNFLAEGDFYDRNKAVISFSYVGFPEIPALPKISARPARPGVALYDRPYKLTGTHGGRIMIDELKRDDGSAVDSIMAIYKEGVTTFLPGRIKGLTDLEIEALGSEENPEDETQVDNALERTFRFKIQVPHIVNLPPIGNPNYLYKISILDEFIHTYTPAENEDEVGTYAPYSYLSEQEVSLKVSTTKHILQEPPVDPDGEYSHIPYFPFTQPVRDYRTPSGSAPDITMTDDFNDLWIDSSGPESGFDQRGFLVYYDQIDDKLVIQISTDDQAGVTGNSNGNSSNQFDEVRCDHYIPWLDTEGFGEGEFAQAFVDVDFDGKIDFYAQYTNGFAYAEKYTYGGSNTFVDILATGNVTEHVITITLEDVRDQFPGFELGTWHNIHILTRLGSDGEYAPADQLSSYYPDYVAMTPIPSPTPTPEGGFATPAPDPDVFAYDPSNDNGKFLPIDLPGLNFIPPRNIAMDGQSVLLHNGEFYWQETDLSIAGRAIDFTFTRTYRNKKDFDGPLGWNWDHSYNQYLIKGEGVYIYCDGLGRTYDFEPHPTLENTYWFKGLYCELRPFENGAIIEWADKTVYKFENKFELNTDATFQVYQITSIKDANTNEMVFEYKIFSPEHGLGNENKFPFLTKVTTDNLNEIKFKYAKNGENYRIVEMWHNISGRQDADGNAITERKIIYGYNYDLLTSVTLGNRSSGYVYHTPDNPSDSSLYRNDVPNNKRPLRNNIEVIKTAGVPFLSIEYNETAGDIDFDKVIKQTYGDQEGDAGNKGYIAGGEYTYTYGETISEDGNEVFETVVNNRRSTDITWQIDKVRFLPVKMEFDDEIYENNQPTNAKITTKWSHNVCYEVTKMTPPKGAIYNYIYEIDKNPAESDPQKMGNLREAGRGDIVTKYDFYNEYGMPELKTLPNTEIVHTVYNMVNLSRIVYPDGYIINYVYKDKGLIDEEYDNNSPQKKIKYGYDSKDYVETIKILKEGKEEALLLTKYTRDSVGVVTSKYVGDATREWKHFHNVYDEVVKIQSPGVIKDNISAGPHNPVVFNTKYTYDEKGNIESIEYKENDATYLTEESLFDILGNPFFVSTDMHGSGTNKTQNFEYDENENLKNSEYIRKVAIGGEQTITTTFQHNNRSQVKQEKHKLLSVDGYDYVEFKSGYDKNGNNVYFKDARDFEYSIVYDAYDRPASENSPNGLSKITNYQNNNNQVTSIEWKKDGTLKKQIEFTLYDQMNRVKKQAERIHRPGLSYPFSPGIAYDTYMLTEFCYNKNGSISDVKIGYGAEKTDAADFSTSSIFYDEAGRKVKTVDPEDNYVEVEYDKYGQVEKEIIGQQESGGLKKYISTSDYDTLGRPYKKTQPKLNGGSGIFVTRNFFKNTQNPTKVKTPKGRIDVFDYDSLGRLLSATKDYDPNQQPGPYEIDSITETMTRDVDGNVKTYTKEDSEVKFRYGIHGLPVIEMRPSGVYKFKKANTDDEYDIKNHLVVKREYDGNGGLHKIISGYVKTEDEINDLSGTTVTYYRNYTGQPTKTYHGWNGNDVLMSTREYDVFGNLVSGKAAKSYDQPLDEPQSKIVETFMGWDSIGRNLFDVTKKGEEYQSTTHIYREDISQSGSSGGHISKYSYNRIRKSVYNPETQQYERKDSDTEYRHVLSKTNRAKFIFERKKENDVYTEKLLMTSTFAGSNRYQMKSFVETSQNEYKYDEYMRMQENEISIGNYKLTRQYTYDNHNNLKTDNIVSITNGNFETYPQENAKLMEYDRFDRLTKQVENSSITATNYSDQVETGWLKRLEKGYDKRNNVTTLENHWKMGSDSFWYKLNDQNYSLSNERQSYSVEGKFDPDKVPNVTCEYLPMAKRENHASNPLISQMPSNFFMYKENAWRKDTKIFDAESRLIGSFVLRTDDSIESVTEGFEYDCIGRITNKTLTKSYRDLLGELYGSSNYLRTEAQAMRNNNSLNGSRFEETDGYYIFRVGEGQTYTNLSDAVKDAKQSYRSDQKPKMIEIVLYDGEYDDQISLQGLKQEDSAISIVAALDNNPILTKGISITECDNISIAGITIKDGAGIEAQHVNNLNIKGVLFENIVQEEAIQLTTCTNVKIKGNEFYMLFDNYAVEVLKNCENIKISNNYGQYLECGFAKVEDSLKVEIANNQMHHVSNFFVSAKATAKLDIIANVFVKGTNGIILDWVICPRIVNNIIAYNSRYGIVANTPNVNHDCHALIDYNDQYENELGWALWDDSEYQLLSTFQTLGFGEHSRDLDPEFISLEEGEEDLRLSETSPLLDGGIFLPDYYDLPAGSVTQVSLGSVYEITYDTEYVNNGADLIAEINGSNTNYYVQGDQIDRPEMMYSTRDESYYIFGYDETTGSIDSLYNEDGQLVEFYDYSSGGVRKTFFNTEIYYGTTGIDYCDALGCISAILEQRPGQNKGRGNNGENTFENNRDTLNWIVHTLEYDRDTNTTRSYPYGYTVIENGTSAYGNSLGFQGRPYSASGLYNFRARWYDPVLGRFLSPDPLGYIDDFNLYQFAFNNPISFRDPTGRWVNWLAGLIVGVGVGLYTGDWRAGVIAGLGVATFGALLPHITAAVASTSAVTVTASEVIAGTAAITLGDAAAAMFYTGMVTGLIQQGASDVLYQRASSPYEYARTAFVSGLTSLAFFGLGKGIEAFGKVFGGIGGGPRFAFNNGMTNGGAVAVANAEGLATVLAQGASGFHGMMMSKGDDGDNYDDYEDYPEPGERNSGSRSAPKKKPNNRGEMNKGSHEKDVIDSIVDDLDLTPDERKILHKYLQGEDLEYNEILKLGKQIKDKEIW